MHGPPSAQRSKGGKRIRFNGTKQSVIDGPFTETKDGFTPEEQTREADLCERIGNV